MKNKYIQRGEAAEGAWEWFKSKFKNSVILGGALGLSSLAAAEENPNAKADDIFLNNKTSKTELSIDLPESGTKSQEKDTIVEGSRKKYE